MKTIHNRSTGLSNFRDAYSNLYQITEPSLEKIKVKELLVRISQLYQDQFKKEKIDHQVDCPFENLAIEIDNRLIEHMLINLVKNAIEAVETSRQKFINLSAKINGNDLIISLVDNGTGIPKEQLESIFIPFYTTKEKGSGIGLSFSQHVMRLHNGYLNVISNPDSGSEFQLVFRKIINNDAIQD